LEAIIAIKKLSKSILALCDKEFLAQSRIHKLDLFSGIGQEVIIKREDETGFLVSGTIRRKYASLLPWLLQKGITEVALIGGEHSNHLPAFLQLCREKKIKVRIFIKKSHQQAYRGNRFLLHLIAHPDEFVELDGKDWPRVEEIAQEMLGPSGFVVPEGASCPPALAGAASLMLDLVRNEASLGQAFDHIFVDAGTGMSATGLLFAHQFLQHPSQLHVVLMADPEDVFKEKIEQYRPQWQAMTKLEANPGPLPLFYRPQTGKSFGSVNRAVLDSIVDIAKKEGLLLDPVYNAKLFSTVYQILANPEIKGNICIVHSGGGTGLMGFAETLTQKNPAK